VGWPAYGSSVGSSPTALRPGRAANTGQGWETARRRDDGNDWVVVRLVAAGTPREIEIDTTHFIGNAPAAATVSLRIGDEPWRPVLERVRLQPDTRHRLPLVDAGTADQLRVDLFPDGGLARLRVRGELSAPGLHDVRARWWASLPAWHRDLLGDANAGPSFT
jgi:allantoicase